MKRSKQVNRESSKHKTFADKAKQMQDQWRPLRKGSMETVEIFQTVADERDASSLILARQALLREDLQLEAHELLLDYNFDVKIAWFRTGSGREYGDRKWWVNFLNKIGEYSKTLYNLLVIEKALAEKAREHWTYQQTCTRIALEYKEKIQDVPADEYNRWRLAGADEWAFAKFVGMKAAEIGDHGKTNAGLDRRAHDARKEKGAPSRFSISNAERRQAKYDLLFESIHDIPHSTGTQVTVDGKEVVVSTPPLMCPNEKGERLWRDIHTKVADQLSQEGRDAHNCPIKLNSELYAEGNDLDFSHFQ